MAWKRVLRHAHSKDLQSTKTKHLSTRTILTNILFVPLFLSKLFPDIIADILAYIYAPDDN